MPSSARRPGKRAFYRAPIAYGPRRHGQSERGAHAHRSGRARQDGGGHRAPPDRNRQRGDGVESHAGEGRPVGRRGRRGDAGASWRNAVDAVITILTDAAAIDEVYSGPAGLLAGDVAGKLFIEMSTVRPQVEIALAAKVRAKGADFRRMSGRRHHRRRRDRASSSDSWAAEGRCRAARGRCSTRSAGKRRALRAGRCRLGDEAHHQSAAAGLLGRRYGEAFAVPRDSAGSQRA